MSRRNGPENTVGNTATAAANGMKSGQRTVDEAGWRRETTPELDCDSRRDSPNQSTQTAYVTGT